MRKVQAVMVAMSLMAASTVTAQIPSPQRSAADQERARQAQAAKAAANAMPDTRGTGPYPAMIEVDPSLPNHVVYRPANLGALAGRKLGILLWGNGGCTDDGASAR